MKTATSKQGMHFVFAFLMKGRRKNRRRILHHAGLFGAAAGCCVAVAFSLLHAQAEEAGGSAPVAENTAAPGPRLPDDAYGEEPVGIPYSSLFRNTGAPYLRTSQSVGIESEPRTEDLEADFALRPVRFRASVPFLHRGFEPKDADLKIGPAYLRLFAITAGFLYSDNARRSEEDRESGYIGIVQMSAAITVQLTETFQMRLAGNLTLLPFEGSAGLSGFGVDLTGPFLAGLNATPLLQGQVAYDTVIAGWPVVFADDFRASYGGFSSNLGAQYSFVLFEGFDFDEKDRVGRYVFAPRGGQKIDKDERVNESDQTRDFLYFSNVVSAQTERLLPGSVRLRAGLFHENLWYNRSDRGLPGTRDEVQLYGASERENLRFKPYGSYRAVWVDHRDGIRQEVNAGIAGPITDQLNARAGLGWFLPPSGGGRLLWTAALDHTAGPYTRHTVWFRRGISEFADEIQTSIGYRLHQTLGPSLKAELFAHYGTAEDADYGNDRRFYQTGLRLAYYYSPRTEFSLAGIYTDRRRDDLYGAAKWWLVRAEVHHRLTDTFTGRLYYQFQKRDSESVGNDFYENLVFLSLTKYLH